MAEEDLSSGRLSPKSANARGRKIEGVGLMTPNIIPVEADACRSFGRLLPRSRTREQGDARPPDALLFCPRGCPRGRKVRRNAKAHSSREGRFRVGRCLREKKRKRPSTFSTALGKPGFLESRARVPRARFVFGGRIGLAKKAVPINRGRSIEKRRLSRIPNSWRVPTSGKRFAVDLQRSKILSTRLLFSRQT